MVGQALCRTKGGFSVGLVHRGYLFLVCHRPFSFPVVPAAVSWEKVPPSCPQDTGRTESEGLALHFDLSPDSGLAGCVGLRTHH